MHPQYLAGWNRARTECETFKKADIRQALTFYLFGDSYKTQVFSIFQEGYIDGLCSSVGA